MEYKSLGASGLQVSAVGLGCNNFGMRIDKEKSAEVVGRALELGINFFDTAEVYGNGRSEEILGEALRGRRHEAIIATKVAPPLRPDQVMQAGRENLRRLDVESIETCTNFMRRTPAFPYPEP